MLQAGRFEVCPLGADEAVGLLSRYRHEAPDVVLVPNLAIHYPYARVFMLARGQAQLRDALLLGLKRAFDDRSHHRILSAQAGLGALLSGQQAWPARVLSVPNPWMADVYRAFEPRHLHPKLPRV
jgi:hypothetical protein